MTRRKRLPWSTPQITHEPVAWEVSAVLAGESKLISKSRQTDQHGRLLADKEGRPATFDATTIEHMQEKLRSFLVERRKALGCLPLRSEDIAFLRQLMDAAGTQSTDRILNEQIIRPVRQKLPW